MAFILFTSLFVIVIMLAYIYLKYQCSPSPDDLPGMTPHILFGNLFNSGILAGKKTFQEAMLDFQHRYGDKFQFWYGSHRCLVFCRLEHAQTILTDRFTFAQSPLTFPNFDLLCPSALAMIDGAKWKRHIRVLVPMFKRVNMVGHLDTIVRYIDSFIDRNLHPDQIHQKLLASCQLLTMNVLGFIIFGYDLDLDVDSSITVAFYDFISYASLLTMMPRVSRWLTRIYLKCNWRYQRTSRLIRELAEKVIKQEQEKKKVIENHRSKNLIASLVSSLNEEANDEQVSSGLTRSEIFDEVFMTIVAGYDGIASAIAWFIFYVSKNPEVQQRIKDELREQNLLMNNNVEFIPPLTQDNLNSLIYCECVMKEVRYPSKHPLALLRFLYLQVLRLAPIAFHVARVATQDTIVDNVKIPRGQTVFVAINNININARYWHHADPQQFVPERFLGEDRYHHPLAMMSFGGGHRACLGKEYVVLQLKTIIVRLMQRGITFEDTPENIGGYEDGFTCFPKQLVVRVRFDRS